VATAMVLDELGSERLVSSVGEEGLLVKEGEDTLARLGNKVDGGLRVDAEVNHGPLNLLTLVLSLLEVEHVVVKELLETLVGKVKSQLLEADVVENFETGNIEDTNELVLFDDLEALVNLVNDPEEETTVEGLGESVTAVGSLVGVEGPGNKVATGQNTRTEET